jgi:hypothetical protein
MDCLREAGPREKSRREQPDEKHCQGCPQNGSMVFGDPTPHEVAVSHTQTSTRGQTAEGASRDHQMRESLVNLSGAPEGEIRQLGGFLGLIVGAAPHRPPTARWLTEEQKTMRT